MNNDNGKFYKLGQSLAARRDLLAADKLVLAVVIDRIGNNGHCWPGIRCLSRDTGLHTGTIVKSLVRLEGAGEIVIERQGSGRSNRYALADGSARKLRTLESEKRAQDPRAQSQHKRAQDPHTGARKTRALARVGRAHNQTDSLNQTTVSASFAFVLRNGKPWHLPLTKLDEYRGTFASLDVDGELHKAAQWLLDNPGRRKTAAGMMRFLGGWLGRAKPKPEPQRGDPDWLPTEQELNEIHAQC